MTDQTQANVALGCLFAQAAGATVTSGGINVVSWLGYRYSWWSYG